ncbi:hypothetical protein TNIN_115681 [Trichonephila inaurata madagascariensis]|uniref:Uncharacterized protein n=1 Tax=Trichonephila inaurata madagascariensis TaxID=2747483 RepID=A0A8X6X3Q7_9ARAC|nr:hypothetical protein TNIN_115681 [Trichonephila inaurata madagascariensis]
MREPYHFDELRQLELDGDRKGLRNINHRSNQLVVPGDEIVVQPLRIGVSFWKRGKKGLCNRSLCDNHCNRITRDKHRFSCNDAGAMKNSALLIVLPQPLTIG